jgi:two-component system, chemotaxis family, chemotaxis protein CheY
MSAALDGKGNFQHRSILVADDVRFSRLTVVRMLRRIGCANVLEAEEGEAALRCLAEKKADCLIADVLMPGMSGLQLLRAIRVGTAGVPRDLPVIFLTGQAEFGSVGPALLLDLDELVTKPAGQHTLLACLERLFDPEHRAIRSSALAPPEIYAAVDLSPLSVESVSELPVESERMVSLAEASENSILMRDFLYSNGRLLLPAGVRLSSAVLERLRQLAVRSDIPAELWIGG